MSVGNNLNRRNSKSRTHSVNNSSGFNRPRRFSLLYSSSDDEEEDDDDDNGNLSENNNDQLANLKNRRKSKSVSKPTPGSNSNTEMKMMALRNKLKLLKSATINNNNNNHKDPYNDHLSSNNSLQSTAKMRKQQQQQQNLISSSSDDENDDDDDDDKTSSDDEKDIKPFSLNNKKDVQSLPNLKTVSDLSDLSESPDLELSKTTGDEKEDEVKEKTDHKSASISSDELNEKELLKAISSESDVEQEEEDLILEDDFSMDLNLDLDLEDEKHIYNKNNNSLEMFSNVAEVPSFKNHSDIFVAEEEEEEEEDIDINLGKDNNNEEKDDDYDDNDDEDIDDDEDDYDEMLLEAALITDSESTNGHLVHSSLSNNEDDDENEDNDDTNNDNVFINVDDLDPHSFYFDNEIDEDEDDDDQEDNDDNKNISRNPFFQDEESTDEEQELPEISNKIKTRSRSIHNLHDSAFGKNLPKLNCWKADGRRPFSIIDGLSTKSLYSIVIEDDDDDEEDDEDDDDDQENDDDSCSSNGNNAKNNLLTPASKISFPGITKRKNSFFAARANINDQLLEEATSNDTTPKLRSHEKSKPLESKNIVHDFSMNQLIAISSSDNKEEDEEQEDNEDNDDDDESNGEVDETATQLPPSATNSTEEIQMVFHKDKKDNDDGDEDLFTENGLNALMNKELIIEFSAPSGSNPLDQFRRNSLTNFQNHLNSDNSDNNSKLGSADFALIQQLTQQQQDPLAGSTANRRGSVIMEEAKEGQLRYTKSGLFSEAVMMNLEEFI
ncbi:hypothetical protein HANVADRAFT_52513, partial [Hanseniaspora valbyensis NRRL Y-1626]